uniref:NAC domain-containing protein n=1 Tax=Ananas comosus var. bracteatus TaxID=296719 RepID=A0A6V7PFQ8_ANACO|nr:unnamed protein product [Ananas comosus var. bracteatus]
MAQQCHPSSHGTAPRPSRSQSEESVALGFAFTPTDEQLIVHYLRAYAAGQSLRWDHVVEAQVYSTDPRSLLGDDGEIGYFLTKRTRHGNRVKRTAGRGRGPAKPRKTRSCPPAAKSSASKRCSRSVSATTTTAHPRNHPRRRPDTSCTSMSCRRQPTTGASQEPVLCCIKKSAREIARSHKRKREEAARTPAAETDIAASVRDVNNVNLVSDGLLGRTMAADQQQPIPYHGKNVATANADFFEVGECSYSSTITEYADSVASADGVKEREMANGDSNLACHGALGMTADIDLLPIPYLRKWTETMNADIFYGLRGDVNTGDIGCSAAVEGAGDPQPPPPSYELNGTTAAAATADQQLLLAPDQDERTVVDEAGDWDQLLSVLENEDYSDWFDSVLNDEPSPPPLVDSEMPFRNCQMPPPASSDGAASSAVIQGNEHAGESMRKEIIPRTLLLSALRSRCPDDAWRSFRSLAAASLLPSPSAASSLLCLLSSDPSPPAAASPSSAPSPPPSSSSTAVPRRLPPRRRIPLPRLRRRCRPRPALALVKSMLKNRFFLPFSVWGHSLIRIAKSSSGGGGSDSSAGFAAFLRVFEENCRIAMDDKNESMKPDLASCNAVLDGCCRDMCSVSDAERVLEMMSKLGLSPDSDSFGSLAYLYASKGIGKRIEELDRLLDALGFSKNEFFKNLISGCVKAGNFESVSSTILRASKERKGDEGSSLLDDESYIEVAKCYLDNGRIKELASLIITTQELESSIQSVRVDCSFGFGIVNACVGLEQRTAEAAQLVTEISAAGLQLDVSSYDALIDVSMSAQDFQSAFSLFRDMREARLPDIKTSYLTIMTGLMENQRPELMASFLDSIVDDPRENGFSEIEPNSQTYLSLINGYVSIQKYFSVLILWTEVRKKGIDFDHDLIDAFLFALVKGGFFDAAMQVVEKAQELKIFVDKWRHKQAFMETHKKLKVAKLRKRNFRKMEALVAFKNWAGLNA